MRTSLKRAPPHNAFEIVELCQMTPETGFTLSKPILRFPAH